MHSYHSVFGKIFEPGGGKVWQIASDEANGEINFGRSGARQGFSN